MPRRIVIFDTNIYYELSEATAIELRSRERRADAVGCASVLVTLELLSHLDDPLDVKFEVCLKALRALRAHVSVWSYGEQIPFFGTARDAWRAAASTLVFPGRGQVYAGCHPRLSKNFASFDLFCRL